MPPWTRRTKERDKGSPKSTSLFKRNSGKQTPDAALFGTHIMTKKTSEIHQIGFWWFDLLKIKLTEKTGLSGIHIHYVAFSCCLTQFKGIFLKLPSYTKRQHLLGKTLKRKPNCDFQFRILHLHSPLHGNFTNPATRHNLLFIPVSPDY